MQKGGNRIDIPDQLFDSEPIEVGISAGFGIHWGHGKQSNFGSNPFAGFGLEFISNAYKPISIDTITELASRIGGQNLHPQENSIRLHRLLFEDLFFAILQGVGANCLDYKQSLIFFRDIDGCVIAAHDN